MVLLSLQVFTQDGITETEGSFEKEQANQEHDIGVASPAGEAKALRNPFCVSKPRLGQGAW